MLLLIYAEIKVNPYPGTSKLNVYIPKFKMQLYFYSIVVREIYVAACKIYILFK